MAEGKKFSERKSRLQDFKASIGGGGGQTQQTQQDDGSQQTGKVFDTPRSLDIPRSNRSGGIELPGITTQYDNTLPKTGFIGSIEQGKVQGNVVLPGINDRATRMSEIDPYDAVQGMIQFQKDEDKKLKSQYGLLVKRGVKQIGDTYSKWANANLSKEGILEKLARIGQVNGASKKSMQTYIDENEAQTNAYNKKVNDAFSDWEKRNMDMNIMKQYEGETISGLLSRGDGKGALYKLIKGLSENLTMLPEMVVTMLAPQVGLPLIASDVYIQEAQGTYEEMLENGATYEQAQNGATLVGTLNASVELLLERFLGGAQRAGASFLRRLFLKNTQKEVVRNLTKKGFAEILGRGLLNQTKTSFVEGLEEIVQQLITNAFVKTVNPDRDLGEGLVSSFDQAFWQTFFMPLGGGSESIIKDYQNNKKVDLQTDIEALKYVMEGEERKAQRMQQAKERMKQRFLNPTMDNGYTPSKEQAEQRANEKEENEEFEDELKRENQEGPNYTEEDEQRFTREVVEEQQQADELRSENNRDTTIENQMMYEALNEGNVNEDLGDPRYQKIDEDLQDIKDSLEKMDDNTFFDRIMSSINKGNKNYVVTTDKSGNKSVLRVVERGGNGKGSNGKTITVQVMKPSKKSGNVSVSEFTYTPGNLTIDQRQGIITGFENWGKTGNFRDNTAGNERYQLKYEEKGYKPGVAGKNEKSISGKEGVQQRNKINDETIEQLAKKYGVRIDVIKGLIKVLKDGKWNGKDYAYGMYLDQVLTLSEQIKESTAPHELLHAIFDMIDPETKAYLISQVMKSEGWSAKRAEEWLADTFSNFFRTGKIEGAPKSTWGKIKIFFKRVRSFINGLGRWRSELEEIFTDIITAEDIEDLQGKIDRSEKLNEAKARMKKRFMEYAKNAEKLQKKAESEGKYQNTGKNEENDYSNSGQRSSSRSTGKISALSTPFSFNTNKIQYNGKDITHTFNSNDSFLTDYTFSVPKELQQYVDLFNRALKNGYDSAIIGEFNGKYIKIYFDKNFVDHFEKHGGYAPENLVMTLNRFDAFDQRIVNGKKRFIFEKQLPNGNYLVAITSTNLTEISFYESKKSKVGYSNENFQLAGDINSDDIRYQTVYHGSRAEFDKFDSSHMGEGEGAQVHGWGHYVAVDKNVAKKYYAEMGALTYKGKQIGGYDNFISELDDLPTDKRNMIQHIAYEVQKKDKTVEGAKADLIRSYEKDINDLTKYIAETKKKWEKVKQSGKNTRINYQELINRGNQYLRRDELLLTIVKNLKEEDFSKRNIYDVEIPDPKKADTPTGWNYIEEKDKPDKVFIDAVVENIPEDEGWRELFYPEQIQEIRENGGIKPILREWLEKSQTYRDAYYHIADMYGGMDWGGDKEASKFLESLGYKGIHYYGGRDGEAYVIFNDDDLEITNHEKYQTVDDIDPNIQSPNQMTRKWGRLGVIDKFISEKQKEKALDVSKELLVDEGRFKGLPYMWVHTNKYNSRIIPNFENVKDSRYKEFTDLGKIVAFFTNNEDMSKSYADQKSVLANTKKFKSIEEFNERFKNIGEDGEKVDSSWRENGIDKWVRHEYYKRIEKEGDEYVLKERDLEGHKYKDLDVMVKGWHIDDYNKSEKQLVKEVKDKVKSEFIDNPDFKLYDEIKVGKKKGEYIMELWTNKELGRYATEEEALAKGWSDAQMQGYYHYKGIIQNVYNPLVVDMPNKYWNDLGSAYEALMSTPDGKKGLSKIKRKMSEIKKGYEEIYDYLKKTWEAKKKLQEERGNAVDKIEAGKPETAVEAERLRDLISANTNGRTKIKNLFNEGTLEELTPSEAESEIGNGETMKDVWDKANKIYTKNKEFFDAIKRPANMLSTFERSYSMDQMAKFSDYIMKIGGFDAGDRSLFHNVLGGIIGEWIWDVNIEKRLKDKTLTTNDWVFYALKKGGYDGVLFKNIKDYGGKSIEGSARGGDVIAVFNSNQFKSWDNADPTDSKYISYQKMDSDEKNSDGKKLSNGQAEYFKDSKVRDENGNLLVVYHGTRAGDFTVFKGGKTWSNSLAKVGYRFTPSKEGALKFAEGSWGADGKPRAEEVYLNITNPKIYKPSGFNLLSNEEKEKARDEQRKIYNEKADKADGLDYTKAGGFFHDEFDHPYNERAIFEYLKRSWDYDRKYDGKYGKYDPEEYRRLAKDNNVDFDKILKDFEEYTKAKLDEEKEYTKLLDMKYDDPYENFQYDIYKIDSNYDNNWTKADLQMALNDYESPNKFREKLISEGYDGIIIKGTEYDGNVIGGGARNDQYVAFYSNQIKRTTNLNPTDNEDIRYQIAEYDYDENGKIKRLKFGEENEFDPNVFGEPTKKELIEEDKEKEKNNAFYDAWMRYNAQNYEEDQLTMDEFLDGVMKWLDIQQDEYDQKMNDLSQAQNDPKMLELQLRAVKLMEEEGQVGKKFGKNVSKEVKERQQAEVERKREQLVKDIFDWMYPGLRFEDATYDDQMRADEREAEWEMMGREGIEEKLKYFKKDKNGNWEAKNIKIESPEEKWNKLVKSGDFDEVFTPVDRVLEWKTPQGQKGRLDRAKDPKKYKSVLEKINGGTTKTKVTLKDVTQEVRALEKYRAEQEAEKERKKKERNEAMAKKKQDEYKKMVRMKAFQRLVDMQWFEKYPFLTEDEIKTRYGFTDDEWKTITEQDEIKLPKKWGEKAVSDFNKAVDSQVKALIEGLNWQNTMKRKDAEKELGEIGDIDIDVLLGRDEEKGQKEVEEFEKLAGEKRENKKITIEDVKIDEEREQNKDEKKKIDKLIKSTKSDKTVRGSIKEFISDILTPVSTKIREISPKIHREVMRYFQNKDIKTNERLKEAEPFLKAMKKIRKENPVRFMDIWVNLANRNIGYANGLLKEYGVTVPTELLDKIYLEAQDVGLNINYLGSYYPLSVKAPRKFLEELMKVNKKDIASEIEKKIMEESQKKGGPLEEAEITAIINDVIAGGEQGPDINVGNAHLKKRNTEIKRTAKMLEYCDDPISTLIGYIEGMTQSIERALFLGKSRSGNVHTLADYVYNAKNGLTPDQQDELMDLLKAVFNDANPSKAIQTWRDIATLTTLGSPSSTLTQLGDLSFSVYENGWRETLKAVWDVWMKRKAFNLIDMGVLNRGEEYANINSRRNLLQKAIHNVFKLTFFSTFDTFGKSTFIQSTWNKWTRLARKDDKQLRKDIMKWTDDDYMTDKIINDLKNNNFSEDVALVMYMKLSNIQPLTRAQMPKAYLNNPNGRLFYQFKTFGIKQLDYVLQETKQQTKNFKNLSTGEKLLRVVQIANMVMVMTLLGVGADELKDLTMRRRSNSLILRWLFGEGVGSEQIWEKIEDNVLKLFGLSRYTVMQMKSDPVDAVTNLFTTLPATNIVNYPFKDIYKAFKDDGSIDRRNPSAYQLIPIIGKYRYWIYGGGQDKQQESLGKKKKKSGSGSGPRSRA